MVISYIRHDKYFNATHDQLQFINAYAISKNIDVDDEFVDQTSHNKRLSDRTEVTQYFRNKLGATLLIYDVWVLSTNIEDLVQMFSCLFKNAEYRCEESFVIKNPACNKLLLISKIVSPTGIYISLGLIAASNLTHTGFTLLQSSLIFA